VVASSNGLMMSGDLTLLWGLVETAPALHALRVATGFDVSRPISTVVASSNKPLMSDGPLLLWGLIATTPMPHARIVATCI
jgi:hypothetical protein